jgi:hypothetical protein
MSKIISLPSGATVTLRDPKEFKQKDRVKIYEGAGANELETLSGGMAMIDRILSVLIEEWSFDLLPPSIKIDSLGEMSIPDYDRLTDEAQNALAVLFPQLQPADASVVEADPKVISENLEA